jgi:hypothetical protein
MSLKMRGEVLDEVVKRLRSGAYKQGEAALRKKGEDGEPDTFCCLGVMCEVAVEAGVVTVRYGGDERWSYDYVSPDGTDESAYLPPAVIEWAGIVSDVEKYWEGTYHYESRGHYGEDATESLSIMNDSGHDFDDIADWMVENVVRV